MLGLSRAGLQRSASTRTFSAHTPFGVPKRHSSTVEPGTYVLCSCCSKQRQTAHEHPIEGRIYYSFHPRCGETVLIVRRFAYRGVELVVIPQPDGSSACIPAWMMHEAAAHCRPCAEPQFSLDILRSLHAEIDALLGFLQSDSRMEKDGDDASIRESPAQPVRRGRASHRAGACREDRAGDAGQSAAARDRDSTGKRGDRR